MIWTSKLDRVAEQLVRRARAGDQNAIGTIVAVRECAPKSSKAQKALGAIKAYIERNPIRIDVGSMFGSERAQVTHLLPTVYGSSGTTQQYIESVDRMLGKSSKLTDSKNAALVLCAGRVVDQNVLDAAADHFGPKCKSFVLGAYRDALDSAKVGAIVRRSSEAQRRAVLLGHCLGLAKRIREVADGAPIAKLSPAVAWELGEER